MPDVMLVLAVIVVKAPVLGVTIPIAPLSEPDTVMLAPTFNVAIVATEAPILVLTLRVPVTAALPLTVRPVPPDVQVTVVNVAAAATEPPIAGGLAK